MGLERAGKVRKACICITLGYIVSISPVASGVACVNEGSPTRLSYEIKCLESFIHLKSPSRKLKVANWCILLLIFSVTILPEKIIKIG